MSKQILDMVTYDTHAEIPTAGTAGQLVFCKEHWALYHWGTGSLQTPSNMGGGGGSHPDLATHVSLGLVGTHNHDASYADIGHSHPGGSMTLMKTPADQIVNGTGFVNITGLTFPVIANTDYAFDFYITFRSSNANTGFRFSVNGPAGVVDYMRKYQTIANSDTAGVATWLEGHAVTFDAMTVTAATVTANVDLHCRITGRFKCGGVGGTFAARVASEAATNDLVVQKGSWGMAF